MDSIGFLAHGRTRDIVETINHPETGERAKKTTDQQGTEITETDNRQDVMIHPETYHADLEIGL
jgi:hypothetical protein